MKAWKNKMKWTKLSKKKPKQKHIGHPFIINYVPQLFKDKGVDLSDWYETTWRGSGFDQPIEYAEKLSEWDPNNITHWFRLTRPCP